MQLVVTYIPVETQEEIRERKRRSRRLQHQVEVVLSILANTICTVAFGWLLVWLGGEIWKDLSS